MLSDLRIMWLYAAINVGKPHLSFILISLGDGIPQFDGLLSTTRSQDVVVVVVADAVDWCSVSTQSDERLVDGHVASLALG